MALSRTTTWNAGDVLTAAALNSEFTNASPTTLSQNMDADGFDLIDIDEVAFRDAAANAATGGALRRNAANLTWHDGTAAGRVFYAGGTDVPVPDGGTGFSTIPANRVLYATALDTLGSSTNLTYNGTNLTLGTGQLLLPDGAVTAPAVAFTNDTDTGWLWVTNEMRGVINSVAELMLTTNLLAVRSGAEVAWLSGGAGTSQDVRLFRDDANILAQRNVTNAQAFRLYNTFTNSTNYERLAIQYAANVAEIRSQAAGTGTARDIAIMGGNVGIGTTTPATSTLLDLTSTTGALLVPRMTTVQRDALTAANGMAIYNTTDAQWQVRANGSWVDAGSVSPSAATQAEMEAASSTTVYATPGRTQYHPGVAKGWVQTSGSGAWTIDVSRNVTSITDNAVGDLTVNWTTAFSSANYPVVGLSRVGGTSQFVTETDATVKTSSLVRLRNWDVPPDPGSPALADPATGVSVIAYGDQ